MNIKEFFAKGWPTRIGFYLGKYLPPRSARFFAGIAARLLVILKPAIYHAVYDNQRHVLGPETDRKTIHCSVYRVFFNAARGYYELFHNVGHGRTRVEQFSPPVRITPDGLHNLQTALDSGRGLFCLGCHTANFDLGGIAFSQQFSFSAMVLSAANPPPSFEFFNRLRAQGGAILTPVSPTALREAIHLLQTGGVVITGIERPVPQGNEPVTFFGETAYLPTGYMRLALRTDCLVLTLATLFEDGAYHIHINPAMELLRTGDKAEDVRINVQRVLAQMEDFIRHDPAQWLMFLPVWKRENVE